MDPIVTVTDAPSQAARALISDGLDGHNRDQVGYWDGTPLAVLVSDPGTGAVLGGCVLGMSSSLWGESPLYNLMEVKYERSARAEPRGTV